MILVNYTVYRKETGEIVCSGMFSGGEEWVEQTLEVSLFPWNDGNHAIFKVKSDKEIHYVATMDGQPILAERPDLVVFVENDKTTIQADGLDETTLTGLPDPCEIIIDDPDPTVETQRIEVTGGGFVFAAETPGVYTIEVIRFPFLPWKVEITAL